MRHQFLLAASVVGLPQPHCRVLGTRPPWPSLQPQSLDVKAPEPPLEALVDLGSPLCNP